MATKFPPPANQLFDTMGTLYTAFPIQGSLAWNNPVFVFPPVIPPGTLPKNGGFFADTDPKPNAQIIMTLSNIPSQVLGVNLYLLAQMSGSVVWDGNLFPGLICFQDFTLLSGLGNQLSFGWWIGMQCVTSLTYSCQYYLPDGTIHTTTGQTSTFNNTPLLPVVNPPALGAPNGAIAVAPL